MADDIYDKRQRSKKKRSSLSTWKKKFNIKKRFTNKLPLHGRHIRSLMSGWPLADVRSVLTQYEITGMLKQLAVMADKSHPPCNSASQDLANLYQKHSCCDIRIIFCDHVNDCDCGLVSDAPKAYLAHFGLLSSRWPYFKGLVKSQIANLERQLRNDKAAASHGSNDGASNTGTEREVERFLPTIIAPAALADNFAQLLKDVYSGGSDEGERYVATPQKLEPLPLSNENPVLLRTNKSSQPFRHTILECEQPVVPRRHVTRRKQKHRFSMDERILSNLSPGAISSRAQSRSAKFPHGDIGPATSAHHHSQVSNVNNSSSCPELEIPNSMQEDMLRMYHEAERGIGDVKIVFSSDSSSNFTSWLTPHSRRRDFSNHYQAWISHYESANFYSSSPSRDWQDPVYCHRVILAARSSYFRRLLQKQISKETWTENFFSSPVTLEIEGSVIPPRYMHALLHTMYTDKVDIQRVYEWSGQRGIQVGGSPFHLRDAMMLHHIGCFIEFPRLVQGCEEIIIENLEQNNLLQVLHWTSLPHGSQWVKRQVHNFIREKFTELLSSGILYELNASQLIEILGSDYVNASELDILKCALRWGEHELLRRIEEREPNLLTHTAHSISRSKTASARRRELISSRIDELHDCTAPVLACVRMQHILPANHEISTNAVKRGVISRPPAHLLESVNDREGNIRQWIKEKAPANFVPPRLFQPYVDETRNILDERYAQETDCVSLRSVHNLSRDQTWCSLRHQMALANHVIPDALYMVGHARMPSRRHQGAQERHHDLIRRGAMPHDTAPPTKYIDNYYPVPDPLVVKEMFQREREIRCSPTVSKVLRACIDCCHGNNEIFGGGILLGRPFLRSEASAEDGEESEYCNRCTAICLVRLFVVREHGEPDCAVQLLRHPELYYTVDELHVAMAIEGQRPNTFIAGRAPRRRFESLNMERGVERRSVDRSLRDRNKGRVQETEMGARVKRHAARVTHISHRPNVAISPEKKLNTRESGDTDFGFDNSAFIFDSRESFRNEMFSTSSSEDEEVTRIRRKKKSVSRKGSSSTVSYQSIPDVAASANSSLQRRKSSPIQNDPQNPSKVRKESDLTSFATEPSTSGEYPGGYSSKFPSRKTYDSSSSSSCEENTSENESDFNPGRKLAKISRFKSREFYMSTHPTLRHLPDPESRSRNSPTLANIPGTSFNIPREYNPTDPTLSAYRKINPRERGPSPNFSKLFTSNLNFIDDADEFSANESENSCSEAPARPLVAEISDVASTSRQMEMPELVRDGTMPKRDRGSEVGAPSYEKPDIYPTEDEIFIDSEEQCGKYFFCTIPRETTKKGNSEDVSSSPQIRSSRTSFSFALSERRENGGNLGQEEQDKPGGCETRDQNDV